MQQDLEELIITDTKILDITGINNNLHSMLPDDLQIIVRPSFLEKRTELIKLNWGNIKTGLIINFVVMPLVLFFFFGVYHIIATTVCFLFNCDYYSKEVVTVFLGFYALLITFYAVFTVWDLIEQKKTKAKWKSLKATHLGIFLDEISNFNNVVQNLGVIDELKEAGNPVEIKDRNQVIEGLKQIKVDLERALRTEKILRNNPNFKPEEFSIDLTLLKTAQFEEKTKAYAQLVNEAIGIGLRVQEEMKNLGNWKD